MQDPHTQNKNFITVKIVYNILYILLNGLFYAYTGGWRRNVF